MPPLMIRARVSENLVFPGGPAPGFFCEISQDVTAGGILYRPLAQATGRCALEARARAWEALAQARSTP